MIKIRIGETLAKAGTTIEVPIEIYSIESNVTSLSSYDITISYATNTLDLTNSSKEAIKQTIENNSIINFIPTDTSIFILDEIISYHIESLSQGEIKISAYITDSFLLTGAPIFSLIKDVDIEVKTGEVVSKSKISTEPFITSVVLIWVGS